MDLNLGSLISQYSIRLCYCLFFDWNSGKETNTISCPSNDLLSINLMLCLFCVKLVSVAFQLEGIATLIFQVEPLIKRSGRTAQHFFSETDDGCYMAGTQYGPVT